MRQLQRLHVVRLRNAPHSEHIGERVYHRQRCVRRLALRSLDRYEAAMNVLPLHSQRFVCSATSEQGEQQSHTTRVLLIVYVVSQTLELLNAYGVDLSLILLHA